MSSPLFHSECSTLGGNVKGRNGSFCCGLFCMQEENDKKYLPGKLFLCYDSWDDF